MGFKVNCFARKKLKLFLTKIRDKHIYKSNRKSIRMFVCVISTIVQSFAKKNKKNCSETRHIVY